MKFISYGVLVFLIFSSMLRAEDITINFQNTPIEDVIKFVAKKNNINILINERISGNVNFLSNKPIDDRELTTLLEHVLRVKGYALSPSSKGYYEIVRATQASKEVSFNQNNKVGMKMVVLRPKYLKPSVAASKIKHLASQYSVITHDDKMDLLLISDYPKNIGNIKQLLTLFDKQLKRETKRVQLVNYRVKTAFPKIEKIFEIMKDDYSGDIKLMSDEYQNAVWISANSSDINKAIEFIKEFDTQAQNSATMKTKIIFLKNANVEDVEKTAQDIAKSKDSDKPIKSVITSNIELNALIISSTNAQIQELEQLISQIDIERRQVFVKVQIFEVSQNMMEDLGVKWGAAGGAVADNIIATSAINMGGSAFVLPSVLSEIVDLGETSKGLALGATIDFLKGEGALNMVSEPNLLSVNNMKASIYVGKTQSIKTSDATGSNTADLTRNTFSREDIGLTLEITPQITDKDNVVLKIMINVEDVDKSSTQFADQPTTLKRKVDTVAIVQDSDSIIIGGLIRDNYSKAESKVPLLGDIPFLGRLFSHSTESYDKISTIMILTPYIVENSRALTKLQAKLKRLNETKLNMVKRMEAAFKKIVVKNESFEDDFVPPIDEF